LIKEGFTNEELIILCEKKETITKLKARLEDIRKLLDRKGDTYNIINQGILALRGNIDMGGGDFVSKNNKIETITQEEVDDLEVNSDYSAVQEHMNLPKT